MATVNNTIDKFGRSSRRGSKPVIIRGLPGVGFKLTSDKQYDIEGRRLKNIGEATDDLDAVTRKYVEGRLDAVVENVVKGMHQVGDSLFTRVRTTINTNNKSLKDENNALIEKVSQNLMDEMRAYVDTRIGELKTLHTSDMKQHTALVQKLIN